VIRANPRETVSEKLEAIVKLGIPNSRMKDFHDLHSVPNLSDCSSPVSTSTLRAASNRASLTRAARCDLEASVPPFLSPVSRPCSLGCR
jgi:hypothetical protein